MNSNEKIEVILMILKKEAEKASNQGAQSV